MKQFLNLEKRNYGKQSKQRWVVDGYAVTNLKDKYNEKFRKGNSLPFETFNAISLSTFACLWEIAVTRKSCDI